MLHKFYIKVSKFYTQHFLTFVSLPCDEPLSASLVFPDFWNIPAQFQHAAGKTPAAPMLCRPDFPVGDPNILADRSTDASNLQFSNCHRSRCT